MHSLFSDPRVRERMRIPCAYPEGYTLFREGDRCTMIGLLTKGELKLVHHTAEGHEIILGKVRTGDFFGDYLINTEVPYYPGDVIATSDATVIYIDQTNLDWLIANHDAFRRFFMRKISDKALALHTHNKILSQPSLRDKIMLWLDIEAAKRKDGIVKFRSKTALASHFNVRRPSLSRELKALQEEGVIAYDRATIRFR